jgi:DNA polymerase III subunit epsilon
MAYDLASLLVVDVETSGDDPFVHDVLSVAFVPFNRDMPALSVDIVANDRSDWSSVAHKQFAKYRSQHLQDSISALDAWERIDRYLSAFPARPIHLVGHNVGFDAVFLRKLASQAGKDYFSALSHRLIDTHTLLYALSLNEKVPVDALSSDGALAWFDVPFDPLVRHTAMGDALMTRTLFERIVAKLGGESSLGSRAATAW